MNFETTLDKTIDLALDSAINALNKNQDFQPICFLVNKDCTMTSVLPDDKNNELDTTYLLDSFKDFAAEKIEEPEYSGYCLVYISEINLENEKSNAITLFLKFKNDNLPLKTRIYYFPYIIRQEKPEILFDLAFASET